MNHATNSGTGGSSRGMRSLGFSAGVCLVAALLSPSFIRAQSPASASPGVRAAVSTVELGGPATSFALEQNYPNPFNPTTQIQYSIGKAGAVSLKLYNLLGLEVATLVAARQDAGTYSVQFTANEHGHSLVSGIYFYRLEIGSFISMKKLAYLK